MLQKISTRQLRAGMYIERFEGSWLQHPFWRGSFLVRHDEELRTIRDSGVDEVWIDLRKGIAPLDEPGSQAPAHAAPPGDPAPEACAGDAAAVREPRVDFGEEVLQARRIYDGSRPMLRSMFEQARLGRAIDAAGAAELVEQISESVRRNPWALLSVARLKLADEYTYMHSAAVCALMIALSMQMGLDEAQTRDAGMAGMLHDVGKALVPAAIINKPGKLNSSELQAVRTHPQRGFDLLRRMGGVAAAALDVCLNHHEKMDGSGYPNSLPAERISRVARMGAVCDVYDATTSNRPYKTAWDPAGALRRMAGWSGSHFDDEVFQHFVKSVGIYPIGSFVRLESGALGVVVEQGTDSLLAPKVRVMLDAATRARLGPRIVDLAAAGSHDRIVGVEDPFQWGLAQPGEYL